MKRTMLLIASCGLASGLAMAAQEQETGSYDPADPEVTQDQSDYGTARPNDPSQTMGQEQEQQTTEYGTEQTDPTYEQTEPTSQAHEQSTSQGSEDLTKMSASELEGKSVTTATGEEIGEIDEVWTSTSHDERIATVEVGGFLGIGEKTIAIPLSDLQKATTGDSYQTSMTRGTIEAHPEFDESGYTREDDTMQEEDPMEDPMGEEDSMGQEEDTGY